MKAIKFKTSKGEFKVVDEKDYKIFHLMLTMNGPEAMSLKEITEEQASEIVDYSFNTEKYTEKYLEREYFGGNTAIESLHSLLKSKGIHLFQNPYKGYDDILLSDEDNKKINDFKKGLLEQKTFYNPYIFKLND